MAEINTAGAFVCREEGEAIKALHDVKALGTNSVKCLEEPGAGQDLVLASITNKEKHKRTGLLAMLCIKQGCLQD